MSATETVQRQAELNDLIEAFEAAYARDGQADVALFLPAVNHPLYREASLELLRVDLELSWLRENRRRLQEYLVLFPEVLKDRQALQELAFEEYRLRVLAGEKPSPGEYETSFGVNTAGWAERQIEMSDKETSECDNGSTLHTDVELLRNFTERFDQEGSWQTSRFGHAAQLLLRESIHQSQSEAAFLLAQAMTALPEVGGRFLSFQLIDELGRGSFGRVYLARQGDLANRLVALKITLDLLGEEQSLAQLQHTNVVPIYSVHQAGMLQAVCMPYFGSTTLADVIRKFKDTSVTSMTGKALVEVVRHRKAECVHRIEAPGTPAREESSATLSMLEGFSHVEAVLWLAERLTEGLIHAHERGILHRDLKPANVLLTDEGQPMLLDFNLAFDTKMGECLSELRVGGTLPYMAPENLQALQGGSPRLDARSDVYGLGVVLYELLTGQLPFAPRSGPLAEVLPPMIAERMRTPPPLRCWNAAISPALESLVKHCLQPDPAHRHQSAQELHTDLRHQRQHRPLRHAPEPSPRERVQKWVRRHPRLTSPASLMGLATVLLAAAITPDLWRWSETLEEGTRAQLKTEQENAVLRQKTKATENLALEAKRKEDALRQFRIFQDTVPSTRNVMEIVNVVQVLPEFMKAWSCEEKSLDQAAAQCRNSLDLYGVSQSARWQEQPNVSYLADSDRHKLLEDVADLLYVMTCAEQVHLARLLDRSSPLGPTCALLSLQGAGIDIWGTCFQVRLQAALARNLEAQKCFAGRSIPRPFILQQAELTQLLGKKTEADQLLTIAQENPLREERDDAYWLASKFAAQGRYDMALTNLERTSRNHYGAWLLKGICNEELGNAQALDCYSFCVFLQPRNLWGRYLRGLEFLRSESYARAQEDFTQVLTTMEALDVFNNRSARAAAYVQRSAASEGLGRKYRALKDTAAAKMYESAESDITVAIHLEPRISELYFLRSHVREIRGNKEGADADRLQVLRETPSKPEGWFYRGLIRGSADPENALDDFEKHLAFEPRNFVTLYHKARVLSEGLDRHRHAILVLDKVLDLSPEFSDARFLRGLLHAKLGQRDKAVYDAEKYFLQDPKDPSRNYKAACIYSLVSRQAPKDAKRGIELLAFALRNGYKVDQIDGVAQFERDPQLRNLRVFVEFERLRRGLDLLGAGDTPRIRP